MELDKVTSGVLKEIDAEGFQQEGAYNLRYNGQALCHGDTAVSYTHLTLPTKA